MEIRRPLEWHCKQMDHFVGLNFSANFNFALVGHLLKGNAAVRRRVRPLSRLPACSWFWTVVHLCLRPVCRLQTPVPHHRGQNREDPAHAAVPHQQTSEV